MPSGVYQRTEEHKQKMKAMYQSAEWREKNSLGHMGHTVSDETRKKQSESNIGKHSAPRIKGLKKGKWMLRYHKDSFDKDHIQEAKCG